MPDLGHPVCQGRIGPWLMAITHRKCAVCREPATTLVTVSSSVENWNYGAFLCQRHAIKVAQDAEAKNMGGWVIPVEELRHGV